MSKKKILIVSSAFYPENSPRSFRTTELVKEFSRQGHEVTLLTLKNGEIHVPFEEEYGVTIKDLGPLRLQKINTLATKGLASNMANIIQRGLGLFFEYPDIELMFKVRNRLALENNYNLLISIAVPHPIHWGVGLVRSESHPIANKWVADCGDPYMGFDQDRIRKPFYFKYFEKLFCRKADYITVPVEEAKKAYYSEFRHKIKVIPQGFRFEDDMSSHIKTHSNKIPHFGYAGSLQGGGRNPNELLEFLVNLDQDFKFVVYAPKTEPINSYLEKAGDRIEIREYIPRKELLKKLAGMDFLINLENSTTTQVPSKLIDYYLAGRPVLSVPSKGLDTEIVSQFLDGNYEDRYEFPDMDQYRIENVCSRFLKLSNGVLR